MSTIIQTSRTAIKTVLDAAGLTTFAYEGDYNASQSPLATVTLDGGSIEGYDQAYLLNGLTFIVRVYQSIGVNPAVWLAKQDANILTFLTAMGADRTLGRKVASHTVTEMDNGFTTIGQQRWAVCEFTVEVTPHGSDSA